jgi:hypothetical protein
MYVPLQDVVVFELVPAAETLELGLYVTFVFQMAHQVELVPVTLPAGGAAELVGGTGLETLRCVSVLESSS